MQDPRLPLCRPDRGETRIPDVPWALGAQKPRPGSWRPQPGAPGTGCHQGPPPELSTPAVTVHWCLENVHCAPRTRGHGAWPRRADASSTGPEALPCRPRRGQGAREVRKRDVHPADLTAPTGAGSPNANATIHNTCAGAAGWQTPHHDQTRGHAPDLGSEQPAAPWLPRPPLQRGAGLPAS